MSKMSKKTRETPIGNIDHQKYLSRITKTLYYTKLPKTDRFSLPVTELAAELFSETQQGRSLERLHLNDAAKISRNVCVSPCSLVLALIYLEKLKTCDPEYLERTSPIDLFLVSLMVSCKFLYGDGGESNEVYMDEWAASGGISIQQLVRLERDFLSAIKWEIFVNELKFWNKMNEIEKQVAKKQGINRGYFTYTELEILFDTIELNNLLQCIVSVSAILVATYAAGLLTIIGSIFLTSHIPGTCILQTTTKSTIYNRQHDVQPLPVSVPVSIFSNEPNVELLPKYCAQFTNESIYCNQPPNIPSGIVINSNNKTELDNKGDIDKRMKNIEYMMINFLWKNWNNLQMN